MDVLISKYQELVYNKQNVFSLKIHFLFVCIISLYYLMPFPHSYSLIILGLISFCFYLFLAFKEIKVSSLWLTPISLFFLWNSINVGLGSAYQGYLLFIGEKIDFSFHNISSASLVESFLLSVIGTFFFHLGLEILKPVGRSKVENNARLKSLRLLFVFSIIYYFYPAKFIVSRLPYKSLKVWRSCFTFNLCINQGKLTKPFI